MENKTEIIAEQSSRVAEKGTVTEKIAITPPAAAVVAAPPAGVQAADSGAPNLEDPVYGAEKLERIGGGGFGEVWRVRYLGSEEAWKYIPIRPGSSERTGREAVHARRVNHRNVVKVLDIVRLPEHYVLRMELVRGRDMFRVVNEDGVLPPENAVAYGLQVAQVLAHAHRQGVVHLDLKPHNLLLCDDGARVMVTDFGISASLARDMGDAPWAAGTPFFMAPEQFESPPAVGFGTDIWSLGVTLYWMMSLSYPFRFDGREPREVIQGDPSIPLCEAVPYVAPALSSIIERMLEKDPQRRPASMDEVVHNLESFRKCPGDPAARGGDRAFALAQFPEAITRYEEAVRHPPVRGEEPGRAERLLALVREAQAEHEVQLGRIDARIAEDDPAGALLAVGMALRRFSRSQAVKERWRKLDADLRQRFAAPRRTIEGFLREGDFSSARKYLDQLASLLGVPGARKLIATAPGEEAGLDGPAIQRLRGSVNEKEALHAKLISSIEEAVQAMDFPRARDALEEFQNNFPRPENLERMKGFAGATEALAFLADYPPELIARLHSGKERGTAARPRLLQKAEACCVELLSNFDPKAYPRFAAVAAQAKGLHEAIRSILERAGPEVDMIREAHRRGDLERVRRGLASAGDIILYTDIFKDEDREAIRDIAGQIDQLSQRADRLYQEGKDCLARRQFNKALTAFEEALRIGVGSHGDIDLLIQTVSESADRRRQLQEELGSLEMAIHSQEVGPEELAAYLARAEDLAGLQEDPKQSETVARAAAVLQNAIEGAVRKASSGSAEDRLAVVLGLSGAIGARRGDFLAAAARHAADLPAKLADLARAVLGAGAPATPGPAGDDPGRPKLLWGLVQGSAALDLLFALPASGASPHAAEIIAEEIRRLVTASWKGAVRGGDESVAGEMAEVLGDLARLAPQGVSERIESMRRGVLARLRRRRLARRILAYSRNAGHLMVLFAASVALAGALIVAWSALERKAVAHDLGVALRSLRKDPRWVSVDAMASGPGKDSAVAFQMVGQELPAFSALDRVADPDARFWARCASGAGILAWIAPESSPVLGRAAIRRAIEETLASDLGAAVDKWIEEATEPFPIERPDAGQGIHGIEVKLEIAGRVLGGLGQTPHLGPETPSGLGQLRERVASLANFTGELGKLAEEALLFSSGASPADKEDLRQLAPLFWSRYFALCAEAPGPAWKRFADCEVAGALARGLRGRSPRHSTDAARSIGPEVYEVLRLIARIREKGSAFPLVKGWSASGDALYPVLWPLVK